MESANLILNFDFRDGVENKNVKPKHIFSINGVRQTQAWDALPAGVYVVDGKKVIKK